MPLLPTAACGLLRVRRWRVASRCFIAAALSALGALQYLRAYNYTCSNTDTAKEIARLCEAVSAGRSAGPLCPALCDGLLRPAQCQNYHFQKPVAFSASWAANNSDVDGEVIFKGYREDNDSSCPSFAVLAERMARKLKAGLGMRVTPTEAFRTLFGSEVAVAEEKGEGCATKRSMLAVLRTREFVHFRALEDMWVFPRVVGHCGDLYAMEKLLPLPYPTWSSPDTLQSWISRLELALKILDLEARMEAGMGEEGLPGPLVLCDVKREHFALDRSTGTVKILDGDNAYMQPKGDKHMSLNGGRECSRDADCHVLDCRGRCNKDRKRCDSVIVNNNLQMICEKVFLGRFREVYKPSLTGLLSSKYSSPALDSLLAECAYPGSVSGGADDDDGRREKANRYLRESLLREMDRLLDGARGLL